MSTKDLALGRYSSMPSVGGAPVVESGSNTDGEWTRWADGTQMARRNGRLNYYASGIVTYGWILPVTFIDLPTPSLTANTDRGSGNGSYVWSTRTDNADLNKINLIAHRQDGPELVSTDYIWSHAIAVGYWK